MKRFVLYVLVTWLGFAAMIGVILIAARRQFPPIGVQQLHLADCALPCWIGIVPGVTTMDEAVIRIKNTYSEPEYSVRIMQSLLSLSVSITHQGDQEPIRVGVGLENDQTGNKWLVNVIGFSRFAPDSEELDALPSLAELYPIMGSPDQIAAQYLETPGRILFYRHLSVVIILLRDSCGKPLSLPHVDSIQIYAPGIMGTPGGNVPQEWRGFSRCYDFERPKHP